MMAAPPDGVPVGASGVTTTGLSQPGHCVSRPAIELSICAVAPQRGQPKSISGIPSPRISKQTSYRNRGYPYGNRGYPYGNRDRMLGSVG